MLLAVRVCRHRLECPVALVFLRRQVRRADCPVDLGRRPVVCQAVPQRRPVDCPVDQPRLRAVCLGDQRLRPVDYPVGPQRRLVVCRVDRPQRRGDFPEDRPLCQVWGLADRRRCRVRLAASP